MCTNDIEDYHVECVEIGYYNLNRILTDDTEYKRFVYPGDDSFFYPNTMDIHVPIPVDYLEPFIDAVNCDEHPNLPHFLHTVLDFIHTLSYNTDYFICDCWDVEYAWGKAYAMLRIVVCGSSQLPYLETSVSDSPQFNSLLNVGMTSNPHLFYFHNINNTSQFKSILLSLMYKSTWIKQGGIHLWPFYGWSG